MPARRPYFFLGPNRVTMRSPLQTSITCPSRSCFACSIASASSVHTNGVKTLGLTEDLIKMLSSQVWGWSEEGVEPKQARRCRPCPIRSPGGRPSRPARSANGHSALGFSTPSTCVARFLARIHDHRLVIASV
jgi:hypothetical protein